MKNKKSKAKTSDKKPSRITLATHQDISIISNLHGRLKKCASRKVDVNMIAEKVESIDTSTIQLLASFVRKIRNSGNNVYWQSTSQVLLNSARLVDLEEEIFCQQVIE